MKVTETALPGVLVVEPQVFDDARGFFFETYRAQRYAEAGIPASFVQDNASLSERGVLRGLHLQNPNPQGKLIYVLQGEVFDHQHPGQRRFPDLHGARPRPSRALAQQGEQVFAVAQLRGAAGTGRLGPGVPDRRAVHRR